MKNLPEIVVEFSDQNEKILNPHQRQFLEDSKRVRDKVKRMNENDDFGSSHFYMRKKEEDFDPDEMDEHDSFYHTTKSLLVLFQIMGVMPINRSPKGVRPRTAFSWTSKTFFWAYLIYAAETFVVFSIGKQRVHKFSTSSEKKFDEIIYNVIFISLLLPHFMLPLASWRHGSEVAIFKNMWTSYQLKYLKTTGLTIEFPILMRITWSLCFFSWGCSIAIILSQYYLQPDFPLLHTFAYYHIIAMLNGFCSLWYINCTAFGIASRALSSQLKVTLLTNRPAQKLQQLRILWDDLSSMMQQLGKAYSNMYGMYCLIIFFTTIIATYGSLSEIIDHGVTFKELGLFIIVVYCMTLLFIICNEAHHASRRVGLKFQEILLNVNLTTCDSKAQREIEMFLVTIDKNPPVMNLNGYANINRQLISSNVSFMATYLVVLMQFKLTLLRQTGKNTFAGVLDKNLTSLSAKQ